MSNRNDEIERIQRIRDQQIRARDPRARDRKRHQRISARYKEETFSFQDLLRSIPTKWWGMLIGGIIGLVFAIVLNKVIETEASWMEYVWYVLVLFGVALGRGVGAAADWSEEDHKKLVR
jgi:ABC-type phosphate/phosphonate transport system permease subunit